MKSFREYTTRRQISMLCIAMMILPTITATLAPVPASAQGILEVAVVDFRNTSKISNEMFGTMATDAVVVELMRSGKFGVVTADNLQKGMEGLGYKVKDERVPKVIMTPAMMVRLGQEVQSDAVVTGEILDLKVDGKKRAEARISVRMLDVASGVWMNGAIATGTSNPRIGYTADKDTDLIIEAINNAARQAVETMVQYIIPEATIIGTFGSDQVLLNKGAQDGIQNGMELIVLRRNDAGVDDVVGRIKIVDASDTDARASIMSSTRGLKPEDRVRAVFELPKDTGKTSTAARVTSQKRIAKGSSMLWGLVALIGLATLFKGGGEQGESVPGAIAVAGASPDLTNVVMDGGILVAWNDPKPVNHADIIEYHVWRDNYGAYGSEGVANFGPRLVPDQTTALARSGPLGSFDHSTIDDISIMGSVDFAYPSKDHTTLESGTLTDIVGITPGKTHSYWVSCVYTRRTTDSGGAAVTTYWETDPVKAGVATYVTRPVLEEPGGIVAQDYEDLSDITFRWQGSAGADQYAIEVSSTPTFQRDKTWVDSFYQVTAQDGTEFTKTYTNIIKNADTGQIVTELSDVPAGGTLYWRVGARNSRDEPGPYPANPSAKLKPPKDTRYIYSDPSLVYSFMTLPDMPGPPPEDDGSGDSGDDPPSPPPI